MNPALIDALQEAGVWKFLGWALFNHLKISSEFTHGCECSHEQRAQFGKSPHGRECSMWKALRALGLEGSVVEWDWGEAISINEFLSERHITATIERISKGHRLDGFARGRWLDRGDEAGAWGSRQVRRVLAANDMALVADAERERL